MAPRGLLVSLVIPAGLMAAPAALAQSDAGEWRPQQVEGEAPVYPGTALRRAQEGDCSVVFRIDQQGRIDEFEISCSDPVFEPAALAAVSSWRFTPWPGPEMLSVRRYSKPIRFRLDD